MYYDNILAGNIVLCCVTGGYSLSIQGKGWETCVSRPHSRHCGSHGEAELELGRQTDSKTQITPRTSDWKHLTHHRGRVQEVVQSLVRRHTVQVISRRLERIFIWKITGRFPARVTIFVFNFSMYYQTVSKPSSAAAAIALRGREPRLSAFSQYVNCVLQYGGVKKAAFKRLSKLCITTSYSTALRKQMELAKTCGEDFQLLKVANEIFLNEADTRTAATRSSTPDVAERHLDEASYLCMSGKKGLISQLSLFFHFSCLWSY